MNPVIKKLFRAPYGVPNALQVVRGQLWIADQITDRLALVKLTDPSDYGVTHFERDIASDSSIPVEWQLVENHYGWLLMVTLLCGGPAALPMLGPAKEKFLRSILILAQLVIVGLSLVVAEFMALSMIHLRMVSYG